MTMAMSLARIVSRTITRPTLLNGSAATFASDSKEVSKEKAEIPYPTKEPKQIEEYFGFSTKPASSWGEYATMRLDDLLNLVQKNSIWFVLPLFGLASMLQIVGHSRLDWLVALLKWFVLNYQQVLILFLSADALCSPAL